MLPKDPHILVSYVNTRLRDGSGSLEDLCEEAGADRTRLLQTLRQAGYRYDPEQNRFCPITLDQEGTL